MLFEASSSVDNFRMLDHDSIHANILGTLLDLGVSSDLAPEDRHHQFTLDLKRGYPVPTLGRDDLLRVVDEQLIALGIRTRGRFGGWRYESCNADFSYMQGVQAVDAFVDGRPEDVYWQPENFS